MTIGPFLRDLTQRAGQYAFHIPLDLSVSTMLRPGAIARVHHQVGHLHYFTKETALRALEDCGYEIEKSILCPSFETVGRQFVRRFTYALSPLWTARLLGGVSLAVLARTNGS